MKLNQMISVALALASFVGFAEEEYISILTGRPVPKNGKVPLEVLKEREAKLLQKTGGFIELPAEGPRTLFVDARAKATLVVDELARVYKLGTRLDADIAKEPRGSADPLVFAQAKMAAAKPLMVIMVVDACSLPALSVYPEERIGIVNADRLQEKTGDPSAPEMRISKEMWRALGFVGGVGFSGVDNDVMQPYYTVKDLDANTHPYIQPMNMAKMQPLWERFGVKKLRRIPYSKAVKDGWAPAPTNELQRVVWEKIKAEANAKPTNPIKIVKPAK